MTKPNVILILTDDLGIGDLSIYGNPYLNTSSIDDFGTSSLVFSNFYSAPVCAPTRAGLLTGRHHLKTGVWSTHSGGEILREDEQTLAEVLRQYGYKTGIYGKWHLGEHYPWLPGNQGFQEGLYGRGSGLGYFNTLLETIDRRSVQTEGYMTDLLTDSAIFFIKRHREQPFFLYLPYFSIHRPHQAKPAYKQQFLEEGYNSEIAEVYGMVQSLDENIGRVLSTVNKENIEDRTIIIFMSDNGLYIPLDRYNCGLKGHKTLTYEGGIHVPFFMKIPTQRNPRYVQEPMTYMDVMPTILDLCDINASNLMFDGQSIASLLNQNPVQTENSDNKIIFTHRDNDHHPDRYTEFSAMKYPIKMINGKELYDVREDSLEHRNLASTRSNDLANLNRAYDKWWNSLEKDPRFGIAPRIPVGLKQENSVHVRSCYADFYGNVKYASAYSGDGNAHLSWAKGWRSKADSSIWHLDVAESGAYEISIVYQLDSTDSVRFSLRTPDTSAAGIFNWKKPGYHNNEWMCASIGTVEFIKGELDVTLKAEPLNQSGEVNVERIIFTKKKNK